MSFHSSQLANHVLHDEDLIFADEAARLAATGFVAADVGKVALQTDNLTWYILSAITPVWLDITAGSGSTESFSAVAIADIPLRSAIGVFGPSGITLVEIGSSGRFNIIFDNPLIIPAGSIDFGEAMSISEGGSDLVVANLVKDQMAFSVNSDFDDSSGSSTPSFINFGGPEVVNINTDDSILLTDNPLDFSLPSTAVSPNVRLTDRITIRTNVAMTNFRARITDQSTGVVLRYLPSEAAFNGTLDGFDLIAGDTTFFFAAQGTDTASQFFLGFVPFVVESGQTIDIRFIADDMNLLGNSSGIPYLVAEIHDGPEVELLTSDQASLIISDSITFQDGSTQNIGATRSADDWHVAASAFRQSFSVATQDNEPEGTFFRLDGLKMYLVGSENGLVYEYDLSASWDISTAVFLQSFDPSITNLHGVFFRPNGLTMFLLDGVSDDLIEYSLGTAWDIATASFVQSIDLPTLGGGNIPHDIYFKPDGFTFYVADIDDNEIEQYDMSAEWDISTATLTTSFATGITNSFAVSFKLDGTIMYVISQLGVISEFNLPDPWLSATAELVNTFDASLTSVRGLFIKPDGAKLYITNESTDVVGEYTVGLDVKAVINIRGEDNGDTAALNFIDESNVVQGTVQYQDALERLALSSGNVTLTATAGDIIFNDFVEIDTSGQRLMLTSDSPTGSPSINFDDSNNDIKAFLGFTEADGHLEINALAGNLEIIASDDIEINAGGNVGINFDSPVSKLHLFENNAQTGAAGGFTIEQDGTGDALQHFVLSATQNWTMGIDNSEADQFSISPSISLDNTAPLQITIDGEIGINKTPRANHCLDIDTSTNTVVALYDQKDVTLEQGNSVNNNSTDFYFNRADAGFNQSEFHIFNNNDNISTQRAFHLNYTDAGTTGGLSIRHSGFVAVGIGETDDADTLLHLRSEGADTVAVQTWETTGTNGAIVKNFVGTQDPEGTITADPGDIYLRVNGTSSDIFVFQGAVTGNTGWLGASGTGNVTTSDTLSNNVLLRGNGGTDIDAIEGSGLGQVRTNTAGDTVQVVADEDGTSSFELLDAQQDPRVTLEWSEDSATSSLTVDTQFTINKGGAFTIFEDSSFVNLSAGLTIEQDGTGDAVTHFLLTGAQDWTIGADNSESNGFSIDPVDALIADPAFHITTASDVGVGTSQPDADLDVTGDLLADSIQSPFGGLGRRQNLLQFSEEMDNAVWAIVGGIVTVTADNAVAPNGEITADTVEWTSLGLGIRQASLATLDSTTYTLSVWGRLASGSNGVVNFDLHDGAGGTITFDSIMRRHSLTITSGTGGAFLDIVKFTSVSTFEFWGWQLAEGTEPYPYSRTETDLCELEIGGTISGTLRINSGDADTEAIIELETGGTNGAAAKTFVGERDPQGNITGSPGDRYIRSSGEDSAIWLHTGLFSDDTSWIDVNANMANEDLTLTSSRTHQLDGNPLVFEEGSDVLLSLSVGQAQLKHTDNIFEADATGLQLDVTDGLIIQLNSLSADTDAVVSMQTSGTNGAEKSIFVGDQDPSGAITGAGGDEYNRVSATTSGTYENLNATSGTEWFKRRVLPSDVIEINTDAEFEALATAGTITISADTTIILNIQIVTSTVFSLIDGADLTFTSSNNSNYVYVGTGTVFTASGIAGATLIIREMTLFAASTGTWFDITGGIDLLANATRLDLIGLGIIGGFLGTIQRGSGIPDGPSFFANRVSFVNRLGGFTCTDSFVSMGDIAIANFGPGTSSAPFIEVLTSTNHAQPYLFHDFVANFRSGESFIRVDAGLNDESAVTMRGIQADELEGSIGLFDTSGTTGTFTAVADASISATSITSVTNVTDDIARFNSFPIVVFVGQQVVISGFTTNTIYNQTALITATDGTTYFEVDYIDFGTDEAGGSFLSNSVTMTDTGTSLADGDTIKLDTTDATDYDGGAIVYNQLTNTFQVNRGFTETQAGTWSQAGLDQTDTLVLTALNPAFVSSKYIGAAFVNDNSTANGAIVNNVFTDMVFGTGGDALIAASTIERWKLIDEINGTFEYTGREPFSGYITFDFSTESSGGTVDFRFKWVRNSNATVTSAFINFADANPDEIFDQLNDFKNAGFNVDDEITVSGSTFNDGTYTIAEVFAGKLVLVGSDTLIDEGTGATVTITATETDLADNVEALSAVGSQARSVTKTFPISVTTGDQIRPQITRNSGSSGITAQYATVYITQTL